MIEDITPIEDIEWDVRTYNHLKRAGINILADLTARSELELAGIPNLGRKSIEGVKAALQREGLSLREGPTEERLRTDELVRTIRALIAERDWLREQLDEWGSALGAALAKKPPVEAVLQGDLEAHKPGTWDYLRELEKVCRAASAARTASLARTHAF